MLQKRAINIVNQVDYYKPTNLFSKLHGLKFVDLVDITNV